MWASDDGNREKAAITVDGSLGVCVKILFEEEEAEEKELERNNILYLNQRFPGWTGLKVTGRASHDPIEHYHYSRSCNLIARASKWWASSKPAIVSTVRPSPQGGAADYPRNARQ